MATIELTMRHTRHEGTGLSTDTKPSGNYDDRIYETDTGAEYKCFGGDDWVKISSGGAALEILCSPAGGGPLTLRNNGLPMDATTAEECNATRVVGLTETLITNAPARFMGFIFNTTSSGTMSLRDAVATGGASTPKFLPDATRDVNSKAARFENGITAQGSAAGTDVTILWRPIP